MTRYIFSTQLIRDKVVLDIGSGCGYGTKLLSEKGAKRVVGIDNSREAIEYAKKNFSSDNVEYLYGDACNIPFPDNSFDTVVSFELIEHFEEHEVFIKEVKRILKEEGVFILSTPNLGIYQKGNIFHKKEYSYNQFKSFLKSKFSFVQFYYQHSVLSNYIYSDSNLRSDANNRIDNCECYRLANKQPQDHMYIIGICSEKDIINKLIGLNVIYNETEISNLKKSEEKLIQELQNKNGALHNKEKALISVNRDLKKIRSSPSWKLASFLHKARMKLPVVKNIRRKNN